jgi:hypothetical protein
MQFNNTTDKNGLVQLCEVFLGMEDGTISGNTTLLKQFTMLINSWYRKVNSAIWDVCGTWEYDDSNYTDLPVATTDLVADQQDYELPSTAQMVLKVRVLDKDGNPSELTPVSFIGMTSDTDNRGMPTEYELRGRSIILNKLPTSDYVTLTNGLEVYFSRDIDEFVSTDTTKEPGFVSNFHRLLSLGASHDYAISYEMFDKANFLKGDINEMVAELRKFYGSQFRDMKTRILPRKQSYI